MKREAGGADAVLRRRVRAYFAALPAPARRQLNVMRSAIRAATPGAQEGFGYGIPMFRLGGKGLVWYAAWTHHVSIYPAKASFKRANAAALKGYELSKGTIRFPLTERLPLTLIKRLVRSRVTDLKGREGGKTGRR